MSTTASPPRFVHLHLHTEYSLLDGGNRISRLVDRVKSLGMDAVAVTDHGNIHGAVEFYTKAKAAGIKPILGIEAYVAIGDRRERKQTGIADGGFHLVLLSETNEGWANLLRLSSDAYCNGFYYKPRMDKSTLAQWSRGLIAINGHLGSSIAHHLVQHVQTGAPHHYEAAREEALWHKETFGPNEQGEPCFYLELQRHGVREQERINPSIVELARELDIPLVCDNDAHFLDADAHDAHDTLCCISMQKLKDDTARLQYSKELYVKSPEEMAALFPDLPEAVENTARIADRCNVELDFSESHAPLVKIASDVPLPADPEDARREAEGFTCGHPVGSTDWYKAFCERLQLAPFDREQEAVSFDAVTAQCDRALRLLAEAGAIWRYGAGGVTDQVRARLDRELDILADKHISAYFLIVWDFVNWARQRGIPAAARGSGVGTMVGYVLGLSNACPERYGLLFERFTDPDRSEYPDIDIDICQDGRADVINYVREKYGYVAQIITFGRLKARQAIKDVARVMGFTPGEGQRLANLVPAELNITIDQALEKDPDFRAEFDGDPRSRSVIETARALEDHARHAGVHAAGVVVATQPLETIVPLYTSSSSDDVVTQWDGPTCERVGLLKMDFLGLRTLSTIEKARVLIKETLPETAIWEAVGRTPDDGQSHPLDLDRLPMNDARVFDLFRRADTAGIFQFESGGMRKLLREMKPDRLEDLIAANALFRPGPMDLIPEYCQRKHGKPVPRVHPIVDDYTAETYGIMVYQEQVMQIVHSLGDIPLREAYTLIKSISKKKWGVIDRMRPKFIEGAKVKGLAERDADELFDLILKFAGYGFNKSHSTGYAIIAYHTAYLKTYYPAAYMAALLTFESGARKIDDWAPYLEDCKRTVYPDHTETRPHVGVEVKPPDLNRSQAGFTVVFDDGEAPTNLGGHIRFGLGAVKGVGKSAIASIIEEREKDGPYSSLYDFCERVSGRVVNKATVEALAKCGAFDALHDASRRSAVCAAIDDALSAGQQAAEDRRSGQMSIFGDAAAADGPVAEPPEPPLPAVPAWDLMTTLAAEKETLGIHVSGHPLDSFVDEFARLGVVEIGCVVDFADKREIVLGGLLTRVKITQVRSGRRAGEKMAMITLADRTGSIEGVVFSGVFARDADRLRDGVVVVLQGKLDRARGSEQIIVERAMDVAEAPTRLATHLELEFDDDGECANQMQLVAGLLQRATATRGGAFGGDDLRPAEVVIQVHSDGNRVRLRSDRFRVVPDPSLLEALGDVVGRDRVHVHTGRGVRTVAATP